MRISTQIFFVLIGLAALDIAYLTDAKKPPRASSSRRSPPRSGGPPRPMDRPVKRRTFNDDEEEEHDEFALPLDSYDDEEMLEEEEEYEETYHPRKRMAPPGAKKRASPKRASGGAQRRSSRPSRLEDDFDDYDRPRRSSGGRKASRRGPPPSRRGPGGRVIPYGREPAPSAFTKGIAALRKSIPDPAAVREAAANSLSVAREATSGLSANLYREVKGLTSSELEQVMLKATRPDDTAVKGKHVERLVGVTYQISARYDIYDAVLRKLWAKMAEKDWRTTIKALYILHRFSADGAPDHAPSLKARLRELRRTRDPKRKEKYFNSKQLLAGDNKPESTTYRAFMSRYAHYVLLRAQCFGGMFDEIASSPVAGKDAKKASVKPITATSLRAEHLDAAKLLLKAGVACQLKDGEECENTAIAVERVASDLIGLSAAVAMAINRALKNEDLKGADPDLIRQWCEFYGDELAPRTRSMVKKTTPKLDAFGLFLPSRMGASVSQDLLQKGRKLGGVGVPASADSDDPVLAADVGEVEDKGDRKLENENGAINDEDREPVAEAMVEDADEYEYEEEEYYDDDEEDAY